MGLEIWSSESPATTALRLANWSLEESENFLNSARVRPRGDVLMFLMEQAKYLKTLHKTVQSLLQNVVSVVAHTIVAALAAPFSNDCSPK